MNASSSLLLAFQREYVAACDPTQAAAMAAYMRNQFPFLGLRSPQRKAVFRGLRAETRALDPSAALLLASSLWELDEREFHYGAVDILMLHAQSFDASHLPAVRDFIATQSWWDTVDLLAARVVGPIVSNHDLAADMERWIHDDNMWVARSALLHQLNYKSTTDEDRLFSFCRIQQDHPDFFIRKAIGWALRQYARTNPAAVVQFLNNPTVQLSPLSVREAQKGLK